ncbi:hypothetical protein [Tomitella cavernea]|uniref:YbjN domain-containing protein n=1 Tax=Tomitella cavernea TaxID=1387982 RepID=A0ABP9CWC9_9ACTN|nr:hypothetical protein [Tomitella cavernea]
MSRLPGDPEDGADEGAHVDAVARLRGRVARGLLALADDEVQSPAKGSNGDGSVSFHFGGAPCAVHVAQIADGLEMVSVTCVVAWDVPGDDRLGGLLASARERAQFGSIRTVRQGGKATADVVLQYAFPGSGLDDEPLRTMLLLVLGGVAEARAVFAALEE